MSSHKKLEVIFGVLSLTFLLPHAPSRHMFIIGGRTAQTSSKPSLGPLTFHWGNLGKTSVMELPKVFPTADL